MAVQKAQDLMTRSPFPLQWPSGWKRTVAADRRTSRFFSNFTESRSSLIRELERIGAANVVITSDLPARPDGLPYASRMHATAESGIAVWFVLNNQERVFACDRWNNPGDNMRAIALSIEAIRGLDRWGAGDVIARAFAGFTALPGACEPRDWRQVLDFNGVFNPEDGADRRREILRIVKERYRTMSKLAHPDKGAGSAADHERQVELNRAMADAEKALCGGVSHV